MSKPFGIDDMKIQHRYLQLESVALKATLEMAEYGIAHDFRKADSLGMIEPLKRQIGRNQSLVELSEMAIKLGEQIDDV